MRNFHKKIIILIFFILGVLNVNGDEKKPGSLMVVENAKSEEMSVEDEVDENEDFIPSEEWKEIKPGQSIPAGLHVRINLQTGKKEAKLITEDNQESNSNPILSESIKKSIKDLELEDQQKDDTPTNTFKTIDQIRKEFKGLKIDLKTDYEIMKDLMSRLKNKSVTDNEKIFIFNELEYYLHQFDNAQDFIKMKGLDLILPALNSSNSNLKAVAAFTLGSAMQSNPKVQIAALENGLLPVLLRTIVQDSSTTVKSRCIYAVSCFIRHFPLAQQRFLEHGGLSAFATLFESKLDYDVNRKLQVKVITLLSDLIEEQHSAFINDSPHQREKVKQYKKVQLQRSMVERGWCSLLCWPLKVVEHDSREKIMQAMLWFVEPCRDEFVKLNSVLKKFLLQYGELSVVETGSDKYFTSLKNLVQKLLTEVNYLDRSEL